MAYLSSHPYSPTVSVYDEDPHFSFTATPVTELDIEALLDAWDDPFAYLDAHCPAPPVSSPPSRASSPVEQRARSPLPALSAEPTSPRLPRSHSLHNLRTFAPRESSSTSTSTIRAPPLPALSTSSSSSRSPSPSPSPSPPTPSFPVFAASGAPALPPLPFAAQVQRNKPLPPVRASTALSSNLDSLDGSDSLDGLEEGDDDAAIGLEDLFGPRRANPFPTFSSSGARASTPSASAVFSASPFPFPPPRAGSPSKPSPSPAAVAARTALFEAPHAPPPRAKFDGSAAFTAPRCAPTPAGPSPAVTGGLVPLPLLAPARELERGDEKERVHESYPRARGVRERERSAGSWTARGTARIGAALRG
ncbi:hypothetical protein JCM10207_005553 [Rhodosporidiobolus poonsookiae]